MLKIKLITSTILLLLFIPSAHSQDTDKVRHKKTKISKKIDLDTKDNKIKNNKKAKISTISPFTQKKADLIDQHIEELKQTENSSLKISNLSSKKESAHLEKAREELKKIEGMVVDQEFATYFYECKFVESKNLQRIFENLISPEASVINSNSINRLVIKERIELMSNMVHSLNQLDKPLKQILIEARIIELTMSDDLEYELSNLFSNSLRGRNLFLHMANLNLSTPGASANPSEGASFTVAPWHDKEDFVDSTIRILTTNGKANILSSPNLMVIQGEEGKINTGEEVPIQNSQITGGSVSISTTFKKVGIQLKVKPVVVSENHVKLKVTPEVSTITGFTDPGEGGVAQPIIAVRNTSTTLSVKNGELITIGGLLKKVDLKTEKKLPVLGNIPFLGNLFKSTRIESVSTQLIFVLKVKIINWSNKDENMIHIPGELSKDGENIHHKMKGYLDYQNKLTKKNRKRSFWGLDEISLKDYVKSEKAREAKEQKKKEKKEAKKEAKRKNKMLKEKEKASKKMKKSGEE